MVFSHDSPMFLRYFSLTRPPFSTRTWISAEVMPSDEELQRKAQMRPQMETFRETLVEAEMRISFLAFFLIKQSQKNKNH